LINSLVTPSSGFKQNYEYAMAAVLGGTNSLHTNYMDEALALGRQCEYGNGASIFTRSGWASREFKRRFNAGMIGINVGVPAPMAWFPFTGWNQSFFGDLHVHGADGIEFYTRKKMFISRW